MKYSLVFRLLLVNFLVSFYPLFCAESMQGGERAKQLLSAKQEVREGPTSITTKVDGVLRGFTSASLDPTLLNLTLFLHDLKGEDVPFKVCDYSCGTGRFASYLAFFAEGMGRRLTVDAVDPYLEELHGEYYTNVWKRFVDAVESNTVDFNLRKGVLADVEPGNDVVILRDAFHLFSPDERAAFFEECARKTPKNGVVVVAINLSVKETLQNPQLAVLARLRGLSIPSFKDLYYGKGGDFFVSLFDGLHTDEAELACKAIGVSDVTSVAHANGWLFSHVAVGRQVLNFADPGEFKHPEVLEWLQGFLDTEEGLGMVNLVFKKKVEEEERGSSHSSSAD